MFDYLKLTENFTTIAFSSGRDAVR